MLRKILDIVFLISLIALSILHYKAGKERADLRDTDQLIVMYLFQLGNTVEELALGRDI